MGRMVGRDNAYRNTPTTARSRMSAGRASGSRTAVALAAAAALLAGCSGGSGEVVCSEEVTETEDGVRIQDSACGTGEPADRGDSIEVTYSGSFEDGEVFDRSDEPYRFRLGVGEVIEGWDVGIEGMQRGGVRTLTIPPDLAYGSTGLEPDIPPGSTLVYEIELVSLTEPD
jgi:FKBP-type peptidyl-prolyl cis-trans isomerase